MLTQEAMLNLASELTGADADGDATSLAAIAWRLYREAGENLAEIGRLRAAIHHAWNRSQKRRHRHQLPPERGQGRPGLGSRAGTRTSPSPVRPMSSTSQSPTRQAAARAQPTIRRASDDQGSATLVLPTPGWLSASVAVVSGGECVIGAPPAAGYWNVARVRAAGADAANKPRSHRTDPG